MTESYRRRLWELVAVYWRSEERWRARILLAVIVALTLGLVGILVLLNDWNRQFYESLQERNLDAFGPLLLQFAGLATVYIVAAVYKLYFTQMLEIRWRAWLTRRFVGDWLEDQSYYRLALDNRATDNPDQRIAEDLRLFTSSTLGLSLGLLSSVVTLASFVVILWNISGPLAIPGTGLAIPGYMVWVALIYALGGSLITRWLGAPLIGLNFHQERYEADFRYGLVRVRENAEGIAMYGGERFERTGLTDRFDRVRLNWYELMRYTKRLTFFTVGYSQVANIFPVLVAAPRYFAGEITLGVLIQISNAFGQVQGALSWFVDSYGALANWKASTDRLLQFQQAMAAAQAEGTRSDRVQVISDGAGELSADDLDLRLPNGRPILADGSFRLAPGDRVLLTGPNGSGKSTLFRAIAGIWPFGQGRIRVPAGARVLFLPQRAYLPIGTLRDAVTYPGEPGTFDDAAIREALRAIGLEPLVERLDESQNWSLQLSGGEQQRLAFARALLHKPDFLFLDEATAGLDEAGERRLYELLRERLPNATVVSIAHRPGAADFHRTHLTLEPDGEGASRLRPAEAPL